MLHHILQYRLRACNWGQRETGLDVRNHTVDWIFQDGVTRFHLLALA